MLIEKFINCKMDDEENVADYIARVTLLAHRLKDMNLEQKEPMVIAKILSSLSVKYDNVRSAWYAVPRAEQNIERLTDHLVNEESLLKLRSLSVGDMSPPGAAYAICSDKDRGKYQYNKSKQAGKCNYCNKQGHWARDCFKRQRDQQNRTSRDGGHSLLIQRETHQQPVDQDSSPNDERSHLFILQSSQNVPFTQSTTSQNKIR